MKKEASKFSTLHVIEVACAAHRINKGFIKSGHQSDGVLPNSAMLYSHFLGAMNKDTNKHEYTKLRVTLTDQRQATEVVDYLKGLSFKAMERKLTDFESNVLNVITTEEIGKESIGIAASLPKVYLNKQLQDTWSARENEMARLSEYVGTLSSRGEFELKVENIRFINSVGSSLVCCSKGDHNIVKFFADAEEKKLVEGATVTLDGYVKSHQISKYHNGKETMINRIKVK
jgi:hypothetical protein|tara:strand:- start:13814 stop:14503 length:690 start_codon:yes stop_codon:yes gene_type:complete